MAFLEKTVGQVCWGKECLQGLHRFMILSFISEMIRNANDVSCFDLWAGFWGDEIVKKATDMSILHFWGGENKN